MRKTTHAAKPLPTSVKETRVPICSSFLEDIINILGLSSLCAGAEAAELKKLLAQFASVCAGGKSSRAREAFHFTFHCVRLQQKLQFTFLFTSLSSLSSGGRGSGAQEAFHMN
eukprot:1156551-Pelagomonas_calceolata.AAC.5